MTDRTRMAALGRASIRRAARPTIRVLRAMTVVQLSDRWRINPWPSVKLGLPSIVAATFAICLLLMSSSRAAGLGDDSFGNASCLPSLPLGLIGPIHPAGLPPRVAEVDLGRELFFETSLSLDGTISCASCHDPARGFADPRPVSIGVGGRLGNRNSPTLLNAALGDLLSWDGRHLSLEEQSLAAILNEQEMGLNPILLHERLRTKYGARLKALYGEDRVTGAARALAAFQRILILGDSPFDRYIYLNDEVAISAAAKRGFEVFLRQGRCIQCHLIRCEDCHPFGGKSALFINNRFHNLGIGFDEEKGFSDAGRKDVSGRPEDAGAFKTPTLRNVALTSPYMHDGSLKTLAEVVEHYNKGGNRNPARDPELRPLDLSAREKADLVAFLESLTTRQLPQRVAKFLSRAATMEVCNAEP